MQYTKFRFVDCQYVSQAIGWKDPSKDNCSESRRLSSQRTGLGDMTCSHLYFDTVIATCKFINLSLCGVTNLNSN